MRPRHAGDDRHAIPMPEALGHRPTLPLAEPTLELRTLRTTIPMRRPAAAPPAPAPVESPLARTTLIRAPEARARSPFHPDAIAAAREQTRRTRRGLAIVVVLLVVPLALQPVKAICSAPLRSAPNAIGLPMAPPSAPTVEPSACAPAQSFTTRSPTIAPTAAPALTLSVTASPVRRAAPPAPKPRPVKDIIDPWGG